MTDATINFIKETICLNRQTGYISGFVYQKRTYRIKLFLIDTYTIRTHYSLFFFYVKRLHNESA